MQIICMPGHEFAGAKNQGNTVKAVPHFPFGGEGFLQFWAGLQELGTEAKAETGEPQDHWEETLGQDNKAEKKAEALGLSFPCGMPIPETAREKFPPVLKTEGFPDCMQSAAGQEGTWRVSFLEREAQGLETVLQKEVITESEAPFKPGQEKDSGKLVFGKRVRSESSIGKEFISGQDDESPVSMDEKVTAGLNRGEKSSGFPGSAQKGSGASGNMISPTAEMAEGNGSPLLKNGEHGKLVIGNLWAEGNPLKPGSLPDASSVGVPHGPQEPSLKAPFRGEGPVNQLVQKLEISQTLERSEMKVQLKPEHLGEVTIILIKEGQILKARLVTESLQVKEALQSGLPQLRERLESQNVKVVEFHIEVDNQESGFHSESGFQSGFQYAGETAQKGGRTGIPRGDDDSGECNREREGISPSDYTARVDCLA